MSVKCGLLIVVGFVYCYLLSFKGILRQPVCSAYIKSFKSNGMRRIVVLILCAGIWLVGVLPTAYSQETLADRLKNHVFTLANDSLGGRQAGSTFARKAADYIASQWEETGITPWNGASYFMPFMGNQYNNLVGIIKGNHPLLKDEYIVVGAHYDHLGTQIGKNGETVIYNGADDNASGTATIIELGRNLMKIQPTLSRSVVLVAFDAEEIGLYGSNEFVGNPPVPVRNVKLMLSVDMVGWYKTSGYLKYSGYGTIKNGKRLILNGNFVPEGLRVKTQNFEKSLFSATDTYGFAQRGIPTLAVTTGLKSPYHKPDDVAELIDYDGMALITEHLTNLIQAVSTDEDYQASGKIATKHRPPSTGIKFGITISIGSNYHSYTAGALNGKPTSAYSAGLSATINMSALGLRPEVYFDYIQAQHPAGKVSTHSITVPFNLLLQTTPLSHTGAAVFAGPYYSRRFGGKQGNSPLDFESLYNRNEAGLNYGIELRLFSVRTGIARRHAYTNFTRTKNDGGAHLRNRSFMATLSYDF